MNENIPVPTPQNQVINSSAVGCAAVCAASLVCHVCLFNRTILFAIKKNIYSSLSSESTLRHPLHSHRNNKTPLDNMSTDNVFNSMFTPQLVLLLLLGPENCSCSHPKQSPVWKAGVCCCLFRTAPVATGFRRRRQRGQASKFPPLNGIRNMSSHQFYHRARGAGRLTRPLATSRRWAAIDRSQSRGFWVRTRRDSSSASSPFQIHKSTTDGLSCVINLNESS